MIIRTHGEWRRLVARRFAMRPGESPCEWPIPRIRDVIAGEFPAFRHASIRVIRRGHNLMVEVNGSVMFKFAWHPKANLRSEIDLLNRLHGRLPVAIPRPQYVGRDGKFFGYRKIPGRVPTAAMIDTMGERRVDALAEDIAGLCCEVQRVVPRRDRARWLGRPRPRDDGGREVRAERVAFERIFRKSPNLVATARVVFDDFRRRQAALKPSGMTSVGFDLQFDNLLVDARGGLTGAVDWGYLTWSDEPGMFGLLYKDHPAFARRVMWMYGQRVGHRLDCTQAAVQGWHQVFSYLVEVSTNRWDMADRRREWLRIARAVAIQ